MKRVELINRLIQEGLSEKTLANFTDKQINNLATRFLGEAMTSTVKNTVYSPSEVSAAKQKGQGFGVKDGTVTLGNDGGITVSTKEGTQDVAENLKGKQKKIDKNHNGKIDSQDFKILRGQKKKDTNELLRFYDDDGNPIKDKKGKQSAVSTKDKDFEKKTKSKNIDAKDKKSETTESKKKLKVCDDCGKPVDKCTCDHTHLDEKLVGKQKNIDKNHNGKIDAQDFKILKGQKKKMNETTKWVKGLVENKYFHNFTSKNEIMELIKSKLNEQEVVENQGLPGFLTSRAIKASTTQTNENGPAVAPSKPKTKPSTKPGKKDRPSPYQPDKSPQQAPQAENAPATKPKTKPTTKPGTKPNTRPNPYQPNVNPQQAPQAKKKK